MDRKQSGHAPRKRGPGNYGTLDRIARDSQASIIGAPEVWEPRRDRDGRTWRRGAVAAEAQELNDQRQMMAAEALKALLEAELRKHGSGSEVVIAPVGELGDWTAAHGAALDPEAADAYIVLLSRLKEDYLL